MTLFELAAWSKSKFFEGGVEGEVGSERGRRAMKLCT